nr:amidohydrolase [Streptomyces sp. NBC_00830]
MSGGSDDVVRFWEPLGLPGLIDVHTHFMPEQVLRKVWAYFDSAGPLTGMEWPIAYRHDEDERLALLRSFGVRRFTSMLYPHKAGMVAWLNGWAADFARRVPDCLHTATLFPEEGVERYVREAVEAGARIFTPFPVAERGRLADLGDRILLGTDFPNIPYPYVHQLHALERLELGDDWLRAVCYGNAHAMFDRH